MQASRLRTDRGKSLKTCHLFSGRRASPGTGRPGEDLRQVARFEALFESQGGVA